MVDDGGETFVISLFFFRGAQNSAAHTFYSQLTGSCRFQSGCFLGCEKSQSIMIMIERKKRAAVFARAVRAMCQLTIKSLSLPSMHISISNIEYCGCLTTTFHSRPKLTLVGFVRYPTSIERGERSRRQYVRKEKSLAFAHFTIHTIRSVCAQQKKKFELHFIRSIK